MKKIIIDSNIIIRIFSQDDREQLEKAKIFFQNIEKGDITGMVSLLVISEVIWILEKTYRFKRQKFLPEFQSLLTLKGIILLENTKAVIVNTFSIMLSHKVDFTDAYLFAHASAYEIFSFDRDFKKLNKK